MVVFFILQDGTSTVDLFCQDQPDQLMRKDQWRKAPLEIGSF